MEKTISILGCGWLGLELAKLLIQKGYNVNGSTTSPKKIPLFHQENINPFLIDLKKPQDIDLSFFKSKVLFLNIPPGIRGGGTIDNFLNQIKSLIKLIEKSDIQQVIYISSTSVYGDFQGIVNEETVPEPTSKSGKAQLLTEEILQGNENFETVVLRLGGLIGKERHPVKYLSGRKNLKNGDAFVNIIHLHQVLEVVYQLLEQKIKKGVYNIVNNENRTKKQFYWAAAREMKLELPHFLEEKKNWKNWKKVSNNKVRRELNIGL